MQDYASPTECSQNSEIAGHNCWAEINLAALGHNARALRSLGAELMAVVKANAYGHGIELVARELRRQRVGCFGVATAQEGAKLRTIIGDESRVFVMTAALPQDAALLVRHRLTPFVSSHELLYALSAAAQSAKMRAAVHLEINTGIGRAGIEPTEFEDVVRLALELPGIDLTGICTHFTCGENAGDARAQHHLFEQILQQHVPGDLLERIIIHAANSPGILNVPKARYGMVRPGLLLYGIAPKGNQAALIVNHKSEKLTLESVLSLRARVILVRDLPAGAPISYGRTYRLEHAARVATIGIGYGDGYSRQFSNLGQVLLPDGSMAPVRGRVCMDQFCVEVPAAGKLEVGDTVTILGESCNRQLRASEIAGWIDATPHEITTCLTDRVVRIPTRTSALMATSAAKEQ